MGWNRCPDKTGILVRNQPERLSGMAGIRRAPLRLSHQMPSVANSATIRVRLERRIRRFGRNGRWFGVRDTDVGNRSAYLL